MKARPEKIGTRRSKIMTRSQHRRVNSGTERTGYAVSRVYARTGGNTAQAAAQRGIVSVRTKQNRSRALTMSRGFVLFLAVVAIATTLMCVQFLRMKAAITAQNKANAALRTELAQLRAENDAVYSDIMNGVDLIAVRDTAMRRYGMKYAAQDQILWYNADDAGYVRVYQEVPEE